MKKLAFILFLFSCFFINNANGQNLISERAKEERPNYINKGDLSITGSIFRSNQNNIQNNFYRTFGGELGVFYYLLNRVGLETAVSGHHYTLLKSNVPETELYNQKTLLTISERLRYNFYEKAHCGTMFIQTGYSFGGFQNSAIQKIHRWEIASLGVRASAPRALFSNLDFEGTFGIAKDNLHSKVTKQFKAGLSYNLGQNGSN